MVKIKKAVLLTIGMLFLSSLVLSLAIILSHNTQRTENRFAEISLYDRFYDLDHSIQRGFKEIFYRNSKITLTLMNDTVRIAEIMPHSSHFAAEINAYSDYLEETYPIDPIVTIDDSVLATIKTSLPVYVMPHDILIDHPSFPSGNLEITPQNLNVENYSVSLTTTKQSIVFDDSLMTTSGSFPLRISVTTNSGTSVWKKENIDETLTNTMTLNFDTGLPTEATMTITLDNPAHLLMDRGSITLEHAVEIALDHQAEQMNYIRYPVNLFTINIPGDNLQKTGTARIL